jgi:hypothetical protein
MFTDLRSQTTVILLVNSKREKLEEILASIIPLAGGLRA